MDIIRPGRFGPIRSEAAEASKPMGRVHALISNNCKAYIRSASRAEAAGIQLLNTRMTIGSRGIFLSIP